MPVPQKAHRLERTENEETIHIMARKKHAFNVLLSDQETEWLNKLAEEHHCARSFIIRQCLRWRTEMLSNRTPICASGQRCYAPHLHQVSQPQQPPPPAA